MVEFSVVRRGGGPKSLILTYEQVDAMRLGLLMTPDAM